MEDERARAEEVARLRDEDYQLAYALDILRGLTALNGQVNTNDAPESIIAGYCLLSALAWGCSINAQAMHLSAVADGSSASTQ